MPRLDVIIHAVGETPQWSTTPSDADLVLDTVSAVATISPPTIGAVSDALVFTTVVTGGTAVGAPAVSIGGSGSVFGGNFGSTF